MGAHIQLKGNLGGDPVSGRTTKDKKPWVNFSVYQPHWVKNPDAAPDGADQYIDQGGFWLQVSWFNNKAEAAAQLLKKGTAVIVSGDLHVDTWTDKETGEVKAAYKVTANEVTLDLRGITAVSYRQRSQGGPQPQPNVGKWQTAGNGGQHPAADAPAAGDDSWDDGDYWSDNTPPEGFAPPVGAAQPPANNGYAPPAGTAQPPRNGGKTTPAAAPQAPATSGAAAPQRQGDGHDDGRPF